MSTSTSTTEVWRLLTSNLVTTHLSPAMVCVCVCVRVLRAPYVQKQIETVYCGRQDKTKSMRSYQWCLL